VRITRKLAVLVAVPLAAVVAFAGLAVVTSAGAAVRAEQLRKLVTAGAVAGDLVHALQAERAAAVLVLTVRSDDVVEDFTAAVEHSRQATTSWRQVSDALPGLPDSARVVVARAGDQVAGLDGLREQVAGGRGAASAVAFTYRIVVADLIAFRESLPQAAAAPAAVADRLRAAAALSQAGEHVGRLQVAVLRAVAYGSVTPTAVQEVTAARAGYVESGLTFDALADDGWRLWWEQAATGSDALAAQRSEDEVARTPAGAVLDIDARQWAQVMGARLLRLRQVAQLIDGEIDAQVMQLRDGQRRLAAGQSAAVVVAVLIAVGLAVGLGRPVVRGLDRLRDAAHRVAYDELPGAVARLDGDGGLGGLSPEEFARREPAPVRVTGRDELAEVAAAFNAVHREAVRVAAAQALLRMNVAAMFVNLARRGQALAGRLTAALDEAERDEHDPQRLARLFEVDLLVTLLGRTNDSLLVLGGASPAQVRAADEALPAVLTAAQSQVEAYARVEIGVVDSGVVVQAAAVDDVVKLLAELLDNGCSYSPPDSVVRADARYLADRVVVQVADVGIGIAEDRRAELNARFASRPQLDLAAVRAMGLTVVGHIAARHGIRVELRPGQPAGTIAEVTLPASVITAYADPEVMAPRRAHLSAPGRTTVPAVLPTGTSTGTSTATVTAPVVAPVAAGAGMPVAGWRSDLPRDGRAARRPVVEPAVPPVWAAATQELRLPVFEQVRSRWFGTTNDLADAGWRAAERAASPESAGVTGRGLPKRRPGAQLVPGGAGDAGNGDAGDWRDPARVSAALAAYSRGLASGRASGRRQPDGTEWSGR
jgi:signal transduction histidine kinase